MDEADDLLRHIRAFVADKVPPHDVERVTELVGRTVVLLMSRPEFYNHLLVVMNLQRENHALRQHIIRLTEAEKSKRVRAAAAKAGMRKTAAAKKAAAPKKAAPRKTAAPNVRAFNRGASGN